MGEARGIGLIGALELVSDKQTKAGFDPAGSVGTYCFERAQDHGLIIRNLGEIMAFCPPLIISEAEVDMMFDRFAAALDETLEWQQGRRSAAE